MPERDPLSLDVQPVYSAEIQRDIDAVDVRFEGEKNALRNEHNILSTRVKKGDVSISELLAYRNEIYNPAIAASTKVCFNDKEEITRSVEER